MAIFRRRRRAPDVAGSSYTRFREAVREDFEECCAYCLLHEILAAGRDNFELDHFRPKSRREFAHLVDDFFNLVYACHPCNQYKSSTWPSDDLVEEGFRFLDFTTDSFSEHFLESERGRWLPLTRAARYTERRLRLNRRHLLELRGLLREIAELRGLSSVDWNRPCRDQLESLAPKLRR